MVVKLLSLSLISHEASSYLRKKFFVTNIIMCV